jgi:hypothetical protein
MLQSNPDQQQTYVYMYMTDTVNETSLARIKLVCLRSNWFAQFISCFVSCPVLFLHFEMCVANDSQ